MASVHQELLDEAALELARQRERLTVAVETGQLPAWVLETSDDLERAAINYGAILARRGAAYVALETAASVRVAH